ncbi:hypothetical protein [Flavihumibacter solisilvae]|nr:hypothetical protein [Flavihumibacter solisilvae]
MASNSMYSIPERFRRIENLHIVFWLIKDMSWAMLWRPLGIAMIFPTLIVAVLITWQTRKLKSELYHNLAVLFWILANCYWMIVEFLDAPDHYRYYAAIPFGIGFTFIAAYYLLVKPAEKKNQKTIMINIEVPENTVKVANAG